MKKFRTICYWVVTAFLAIGMTAGGVQQLLQIGGYVPIVESLGYPVYMLSILGAWKLAGVIVILLPGMPVIKEWAYAGFTFAMSGAAISHIFCGHPVTEVMPSLILLVSTLLSWWLRPAHRRVISSNLKRTS